MGYKRERTSPTRIRNLSLWWTLVSWSHALRKYSFHGVSYRMSDPGTTYRTREEIQRMRSTQDPIRGLAQYIQDWGVASEEDLKVLNDVWLKGQLD